MFAVGLFDHPVTGSAANPVSTPEHVALARQIAERTYMRIGGEATAGPARVVVRKDRVYDRLGGKEDTP